MQITRANIKASTQAMVGGLAVVGGLLQVREVHDFFIEKFHDHPHILSVVGAGLGIYGLLHNPQVQAVLNGDGKPHWWTTEKVVDADQQK